MLQQNETLAPSGNHGYGEQRHASDEPLFRVREAAQRLGVSQALVYALCASGKLSHERHGMGRGTIRISPGDIERYRQFCRVGTPPAAPARPPMKLRHIRLTPAAPARRGTAGSARGAGSA